MTTLEESIKNFTLFGAVEAGDVEATSQLLNQGADPNYESVSLKRSLMWLALQKNQTKIIELLLQHGATIENDFFKEIFEYKYSGVLMKLISMIVERKSDVKFLQDIFYKLDKSIFPNPKILELLIDRGLPVNEYMKWNHGEQCTPLHICIMQTRANFVSVLLERGADVHKKTSKGDSCLWLAVDCNDQNIVKLLLKNGADVNERQDNLKTVLFNVKNTKIFHTLIEFGADINTLDNRGKTPFTATENYKKMNVLVKELAKLRFDNKEIHSKNLKCLSKNSDLQKSFIKCLKELQKMRDFVVYNGMSLYELIQMNHRELALLTEKKDFVSAFESSRSSLKLSYYAEDLNRIFKEAMDRRDAAEVAKRNIYESNLDKAFLLPPIIMEIIVSFATDYLYFEPGWVKFDESKDSDTISLVDGYCCECCC